MGSLKKYFFGKNKGLNNKLVAYYKFDGNANASLGGIDGTATGSPSYTTGKIGNCLNLQNDTTLRYITLADSDIFSFTNGAGTDLPFSISMWIYVYAFSTQYNSLFTKRLNDSINEEYNLAFTSGGITLTKFTNNSSLKSISCPISLSINTWYHLIITDSGSKVASTEKFYINGVQYNANGAIPTGYSGMPNGTAPLRIGWTVNPNEQRKHKGLIDELGIWKGRMLNQSDVNQLYNSGSGRTYPF